jgi:glycosyltransferase involved in cell wall biosynthesis
LRIVMPILEYHPITGGAQRQIATVAPLLRAGGAEIEVWTRAVPGQPRAEEVAGVPVRRLGRPGRAATATFAAEAVVRLALDRPDVVHAYSLFSPAALALYATRALGIPSVVKILRGGRLGDAERLCRKPFGGRRAAALAGGIGCFLAISHEIERDLDALGVPPARRRFLPNGVDLDRFAPLPDRERAALRAQLDYGAGPLAVYVGRLVPEKRVEDLLAAWRAVRDALPTAELAVLGSGACEPALRRDAPPGVRFRGDVADVAPHLRAADAFVLPSSTEGLSNALLEAMAAGLPAVATAVGGAVDLIEEGENGRLVAPGDPRALAAALQSVLTDPAHARALGARARERVAARYALPVVAERLLDLYRELADAPLVRPLTPLAATKP